MINRQQICTWWVGRSVGLWLSLVWLAGTLGATPPSWEFTVTACRSGSSRLGGAGSPAVASETALTALGRKPLPWSDWYFSSGLASEYYLFKGSQAWPRQLQDCAALLRLEYYQGDQPGAQLSIQPGWYFEQHATAQAWDVPVQLVSGVPLTQKLRGVLGFNNARFYHHPLPIFGLVWERSAAVRLELVFPEPALVYTARSGQEWRLAGELSGGGFLGDARPTRTVVEYSSYRIGGEWSGSARTGQKISIGIGVEVVRNFDFFRENRRRRDGGGGYLRVSFAFAR